MVGITRYATYVPVHRLERRLIEQAWGTRQPKGEIAVANYDEDALTLATDAAMACLGDPPSTVDGVYFASVSAPYGEKQMASVLATVCDLPRALFTADFAGSTRAGVSAALAALRAVQAGAAHQVLLAAADVRVAAPESELEGVLGDAAAALTVGDRDVIAELVDAASIADEFTHFWRTDAQRTVQVAGGRFANEFGYGRDLGAAIRTLLERQQLEPKAIQHLALASPDARASVDLAKSLGFDPKTLVAGLHAEIGSTGSAEPLLLLARALDGAKPGDLILVGGYGEGADALLFRATPALAAARAAVPLARWLAAKTPLPSYERYLKFRRLVEVEEVSDVVTSVLEYKERKQDIRLYGSKCLACGQVQYPMARVCIRCRAQEQLEDVRIGRRGEVFTFTVDHLIANLEHPLPMAVIDADGGGRLYLQIADTDDIQIGARVTFTYRRLHEGGGNRNYYWKARPIREA